VRDKTSQANEMVIRIRELKKQIGDRVKKAPSLDAAAERLTTHLSKVEEEVYQVRNRSSQDPLNFPIKLNNQLGACSASSKPATPSQLTSATRSSKSSPRGWTPSDRASMRSFNPTWQTSTTPQHRKDSPRSSDDVTMM
jgi:hypothetical protein